MFIQKLQNEIKDSEKRYQELEMVNKNKFNFKIRFCDFNCFTL